MNREKGDSCECCGKWTDQGLKKLREESKLNPIFNTDFSKSLPIIIEDVRLKLVSARGTLQDIVSAYGWEDRIENVEGLINCGLMALFDIKKEMENVYNKRDSK